MANLPRAGAQPPHQKLSWIPVVCVAAAAAALTACDYTGTDKAPPPPLLWLGIIAGYLILVFMAGVGLRLLYKMYQNEIDLAKLLCEPKGNDDCAASMSRFQLLIFTFVITLSLFLIIVGTVPLKFPPIPSEVLMLLGISASTYAVGKGIAASNGGGGAAAGAAAKAQAHADVAQDSAGKAQSAAATAQGLLNATQKAAADAQQAAKDAGAAAAPK